MTKIDLYSMLPEELAEYFVSIGEPKFRAAQVFPRLAAGEKIEEITSLSKNCASIFLPKFLTRPPPFCVN